ncbi:MAG: type IV toxin-antitoxin system AbiEi family antitoxin [Actinomycetota bacterium]|nr:type IV toxin-antitoxin system AbiEi family antitoxin [Actinomycetota bacterium]
MDKEGYSELSKDAVYLLSRAEFEKQKVITTEYAVKILGNYRKATSMLDKLSKRNRLIQLSRGQYLIVPLKAPNQRWMPNEYVVASLWMDEIPYYIGYTSMYSYWGFTDQIPQSVTILNTIKEGKRNIKNIKYMAVKISPRKMYGIKKIRIDGQDISISDKERTLVDFIFRPMGSWENVQSVISKQISSINIQKFISYLVKYPAAAVRKRGGLMLEKAGVSQTDLVKLKKSTGGKNTYSNFNPFIKSRKGKVNQEWKLIING